MVGIGWTEMLVIGVIALIVIGPKELPGLMQRVGKVVGTIRRMGSEFQRELNRSTGLDQVTDIRRSITEPLKKTTAEIAREFNKVTPAGVEPSGAIKPADPKSESVVNEIRAAAGMSSPPAPLTPAKAIEAKAQGAVVAEEPGKVGPVKAARTRTKSEASANGSEGAPTPRRRAVKAPVDSPGPAEALPKPTVRRRSPSRPKPAESDQA
jgi:sec-independent protein translocase protein TatB